MPISASNVMLFCPACNHGVRVGVRVSPAGQKQRACKKCGNGLGAIGPAKAGRAAKA
jgi:large subunit ribosomal protein L24